MNEKMLKMYGAINSASSDSRDAVYMAIGHALARRCLRRDLGHLSFTIVSDSDAEARFMKLYRGTTYNYLNFINSSAVINMDAVYEIAEHFYVAYSRLLSRIGEAAPRIKNGSNDITGFSDYFNSELLEATVNHHLTYNTVMDACTSFINNMEEE